MFKRLLAGVFPLPPLGKRLVFSLLALVVGIFNLVYLKEIWPHTPAAKQWCLVAVWLLWLALLPQLAWWGWRWLRAYTGPGWLRLLATAAFLAGACLWLGVWLGLLVGGPFLFLRE